MPIDSTNIILPSNRGLLVTGSNNMKDGRKFDVEKDGADNKEGTALNQRKENDCLDKPPAAEENTGKESKDKIRPRHPSVFLFKERDTFSLLCDNGIHRC